MIDPETEDALTDVIAATADAITCICDTLVAFGMIEREVIAGSFAEAVRLSLHSGKGERGRAMLERIQAKLAGSSSPRLPPSSH